MSRFLYGAAVQGIQSFIFSTNTLKEIIGASELISQICSLDFVKVLQPKLSIKSNAELVNFMSSDNNFILHAAGNIKYIFTERESCERVVREFPKIVMQKAPGITISQAVVTFDNESEFPRAVNLLEERLKAQRNYPMRSTTLGLLGILRSRQTGLPVISSGNSFQDASTLAKQDASRATAVLERAFPFQPNLSQIAFEIDKITGRNQWIAVIHADGNGLGSIVQRIGTNPSEFKLFSEKLDQATVKAARQAYNTIANQLSDNEYYPIRPIVLSGDDFTVICRGDIALDYTTAFIRAFEENTAGLVPNGIFTEGTTRDRMTACAGIAFVKANYPFYYAYSLAEELCSFAKKDAKDKDSIKQGIELPQSCIMFHKVQDSFCNSYIDIKARELTPTSDLSLQFGPYYLHPKEDKWTVQKLQESVAALNGEAGNTARTALRRWMGELYQGKEKAQQLLERALHVNIYPEIVNEATTVHNGAVPAYDILVIQTINSQETR